MELPRIKLTKDFYLDEFFNTNQDDYLKFEQIANYCVCARNYIRHQSGLSPAMEVLLNITRLADFLQKFRDYGGSSPIFINSGYRTESLNKKCRGSVNSYHLSGCAADITFKGYFTYNHPSQFAPNADVVRLVDYLKEKKADYELKELILHDTYIHLAVKPVE